MWSLRGHARDERLASGTWDVRGQPLRIIRRIELSRSERLRGCVGKRRRIERRVIERGNVERCDIDELARIVRERVVGRQLDTGGDVEWQRGRVGYQLGSEHRLVRVDQ
jgi:hypothetical protein